MKVPSLGCGCSRRFYSREVSPDLRTLRAVLRAKPISRPIVFTPLPRAKDSRPSFATVSNTNIPVWIRSSSSRRSGHQRLKHRGGIFGRRYPREGVSFENGSTVPLGELRGT